MTFLEKVEALRSEPVPPRTLSNCIWVQFDDHTVRVRGSSAMSLAWNQRFAWSEVLNACYEDRGPGCSNIIYLDLSGRQEPARIAVDWPGARDFFSELVAHGVFPLAVRNRKLPAAPRPALHCPPASPQPDPVTALAA